MERNKYIVASLIPVLLICKVVWGGVAAERGCAVTQTVVGDVSSRIVVCSEQEESSQPSQIETLPKDEDSSCTVDYWTCDLEAITCTSNTTCTDAVPNLNQALDHPLASAPFCSIPPGQDSGNCSCGAGRCVSSTRKYGSEVNIYYCGPCGWVGSRCVNGSLCLHHLAACWGHYCECADKIFGHFYEFNFCEFPYVGYAMSLQVALFVCIFVASCHLLATIYGIIITHRRRVRRRNHFSPEEQGTQQTPPGDTPPSYDDVVVKPPSYQDALHMASQEEPRDPDPPPRRRRRQQEEGRDTETADEDNKTTEVEERSERVTAHEENGDSQWYNEAEDQEVMHKKNIEISQKQVTEIKKNVESSVSEVESDLEIVNEKRKEEDTGSLHDEYKHEREATDRQNSRRIQTIEIPLREALALEDRRSCVEKTEHDPS